MKPFFQLLEFVLLFDYILSNKFPPSSSLISLSDNLKKKKEERRKEIGKLFNFINSITIMEEQVVGITEIKLRCINDTYKIFRYLRELSL